MRGKLPWIAAAVIAVGAILVLGVVVLTGSDDDDTAGSETELVAMSPVASIPAPASPAAQAAAIAAVEQFWTPQRLEEALSNPLSERDRTNLPDQPASSDPAPSSPSSGEAAAEPTVPANPRSAVVTQGRCKQPRVLPAEAGFSYKRFCYRGKLSGYPALTTGRLISNEGNQYGFCTATVAASRNESVLVTAGHCVVDPAADFQDSKPRWSKNLGFLPAPLVRQFHQAFDSGNSAILTKLRSQIWWALPIPGTDFSTVWSPNGWIQNGYYSHDFAAVVIAPRVRNGTRQTIQSALGSQGWDMTGKLVASSPRLLGFPSDKPFNGRTLFECRGTARLMQASDDPGPELKVGCDMTGGSSGGPWFVRVDSRGLGKIVSVNSNGPPNIMFGPRLSSLHLDAMTKAQTTAVG